MSEEITTVEAPVKKQTRGIVLLALGHAFYGRMAHNLAVSLKNSSKNIPITLLHDGGSLGHLTQEKRDVFDKLKLIPSERYSCKGKFAPTKAKLSVYELSPYDQTIFLDVDMIWCKNQSVNALFDELADTSFAMSNEGFIDASGENKSNPKYTFWAEADQILMTWLDEPGFASGRLYQLRSEFMYFQKNDANKEFFKLAKKIYENPRLDIKVFGGGLPDEYALNVAACILHHYPVQDNYSPIYWHFVHGRLDSQKRSDILSKYYAVSIGGYRIPEEIKSFYNGLVDYHFMASGISGGWKARDKKAFLSERVKL